MVVAAVVRLTHPRGHRLQLFTQTVLPSWSAAVTTSCKATLCFSAAQLPSPLTLCIPYLFVEGLRCFGILGQVIENKNVNAVCGWRRAATTRRLDPGAGLTGRGESVPGSAHGGVVRGVAPLS